MKIVKIILAIILPPVAALLQAGIEKAKVQLQAAAQKAAADVNNELSGK